MRIVITSGTLRGHRLPGRIGPGIRPTAARVREALFSIVGQDLSGWTVLDAYAGSGLLGFEAASRGAESVCLVEKDSRALTAIKYRARELGLSVECVRGESPRALRGRTWALVLADPPYAKDPLTVVEALAPHVGEVLVLEHARDIPSPEAVGELVREQHRNYGDTALSVYRWSPRRDPGGPDPG